MSSHTHIASDENLARIADVLEGKYAEYPTYDPETGRYDNETIRRWLAAKRDGECYGVSDPKGLSTALTKLGANANMPNPTPGTIGSPAVDPYAGKGPCFFVEVNGGVEVDGTPYVTAIQGDGRFSRDGSNGDVWTMTPVLYYREVELADSVERWISDTYHVGYEIEGDAFVPDGTQRPYILRAKYGLSADAGGKPRSVSGAKPLNRTLSHNTYITLCDTANSGLSGKSTWDDWYVKTMLMIKYATKNGQSVMAGCTSYDYRYSPTVAESDVRRIVIAKASAANLVVGSAMQLGTHTGDSTDRNTAYNYDIFPWAKITRIEPYDEENSAVYFDELDEAFSTATTYMAFTTPWPTGSCDAVEGDGSPTSYTNGKEPYVIQGIETALGLYEIMGNAMFRYDGEQCHVLVVPDTKKAATSNTADYVDTGLTLPVGDAENWKYPLYPTATRLGATVGAGEGASTSTGMCDGHYTKVSTTVGNFEWLSLGYLNGGGIAGPWCLNAVSALSGSYWYFGGRLSAVGRTRG